MSVRPVQIRDEDAFARLLRGRRMALGLGQAELDERIGWAPAYASKAEAPTRRYGKRVFSFSGLLDEWLEGLGLALVLMDRKEALRLCAESQAPEMTESEAGAYPKRQRSACDLMRHRHVSLTYVFRSAA